MSKYGPCFDLIGEIKTISPKTDKSCFLGIMTLNHMMILTGIIFVTVPSLRTEFLNRMISWNLVWWILQQEILKELQRPKPGISSRVHCFNGIDKTDKDGYRRIHYYDLLTNENKIIIQDYSPMDWVFTDTRTDLHNRWNTKNDKISYDTIHSGKREICEIDLRGTGLI